MSFQQALSGLAAAATALDVIGNNVANSSTVGFKSGTADFSDLYAASLGTATASQVGSGVGVAAIKSQFTQGNLTTTSNPLDLAISGGGFFRMRNSGNGTITYSRDGQMKTDKDGYMVNDQNLRLTGYNYDPKIGALVPTLTDLKLSSSLLAAKATNSITIGLNLDSGATVPSVAFPPPPVPAVPPLPQLPSVPPPTTSYNFSSPATVFDSLGNSHVFNTYYVFVSPGTWNMYATLDDKFDALSMASGTLPAPVVMTFDSSGTMTSPTKVTLGDYDLTNGASTPWTATLNFTDTTQFGSASTVNSVNQNGYTSGSIAAIGIGTDGVIQGRYSNGAAFTLGQVLLSSFAAPNGLANAGNNQWSLTSESGSEVIGVPGTGGRGVLQSASIEESNVDLTKQLVAMITAQRNYQASAQTIKTQDAVLQTLLNLR